jgi:hypothetical protein
MPMTCQKRLPVLVFLSAIVAVPVAAIAGPHKGVVGRMEPATPVIVSGKLLTYEGQPAASQPIHFENLVSGDLFLATTGPDGSFAYALPPGGYDLRVEQGPIVVDFIDAQDEAVRLGTVSEPAKFQYWLQAEGLAAALIHSPAPITSNVQANNPYFPTGQIPPEILPPRSATAPAAVTLPAVPE